MKDTAAVIVTYNRRELVRQCIKAVLSQENASCDIIVLDNGSTDGTEEMFSQEFKDAPIMYTNMHENLGCAESTSRGIAKAVGLGYKYIWIMDDDVIPEPDALSELLKADEKLNGNYSILSGAAYWLDGKICEANRQKKSLFTFMKDSDYEQELVQVMFVSLASMFVRADVVREVGLPHGEFFIYTEDYEFCARAGRQYPIYVVPACRVTHAMKVNAKVNFASEAEDRLYRYKYLYRNDVHCYRQFGLKGWIYLAAKFAYTIVNILINSKGERLSKIRTLIRGYKEGFSFRPQVKFP
ncbi:MAG: glycosyltransferase [Synergistaceae bacterium]|nr:glycosyltransferase [Synergistaceae bacterium]